MKPTVFKKIFDYFFSSKSPEPYLFILNKQQSSDVDGYVDFNTEEEVHGFADSLGLNREDYEVRWMSSEEKEKLNTV